VAADPLFFAYTLASYQRQHNLDDAALCELHMFGRAMNAGDVS
jgi:hypothetical protein